MEWRGAAAMSHVQTSVQARRSPRFAAAYAAAINNAKVVGNVAALSNAAVRFDARQVKWKARAAVLSHGA